MSESVEEVTLTVESDDTRGSNATLDDYDGVPRRARSRARTASNATLGDYGVEEPTKDVSEQGAAESVATSNTPPQGDGPYTSIYDFGVEETVREEFDQETWEALEAVLSAHATLPIENAQPFGLMLVGPSGSGKTTVLRLLDGCPEQVYRSDEVTKASFVSHNASLEDEELQENVDLLPQIQHKTLMSPEMANWFSGPFDNVREKMSTMASVMDGDGYTRNTGAHGERGYTGDYRFNIIGASTPLPHRAWAAMGHTGNRFVFHEKPGGASLEEVTQDVFGGSEYAESIELCRTVVSAFLNEMWETHEGYGGIKWDTAADGNIRDALAKLAELIRYGRAPLDDDSGSTREGRHRILMSLRDVARGHAVICGRQQIQAADLPVVARVALSTMHKNRREMTRLMLDPATPEELEAREVADYLDISRPTAIKRMELMDTLGIGNCYQKGDSDNATKCITPELEWPDLVPFPETYRLAYL